MAFFNIRSSLLTDVAERVFQRCTTSSNHPDHPEYTVTFNYEFLEDQYANWGDDSLDATSSTGVYNKRDWWNYIQTVLYHIYILVMVLCVVEPLN